MVSFIDQLFRINDEIEKIVNQCVTASTVRLIEERTRINKGMYQQMKAKGAEQRERETILRGIAS